MYDDHTHQEKYISQCIVLDLNMGSKRYQLNHVFDHSTDIIQIFIDNNLAFTLTSNCNNIQSFFIWNFRKEVILCSAMMKAKINKFILNPVHPDQVFFIGDNYFRFWDINYTNKFMKENPMSLIAMKVEKDSDFLDMCYFKGSENYVLISKA